VSATKAQQKRNKSATKAQQSESIPLSEAVFSAKSLPRPLQSSSPLPDIGAAAAKHPREAGAHHQGEDDLDHAATPVSA
jgi:hypothetical protein